MARDPLNEMLWKNIGIIQGQRGKDIAVQLLEARSDFLKLRMRHEKAIRDIYINTAENVAKQLRSLSGKDEVMLSGHLKAVERTLRKEADKINVSLNALMKSGVEQAYTFGTRPSDEYLLQAFTKAGVNILNLTTLQRGFGDINTAAVEAFWAKTRHGMILSDRIWDQSQLAREGIQNLIQTGIEQGRDVVEVARDLVAYVKDGAMTLAEDYPNMMARMDIRVPEDLCYEALRLARTEYSMAYQEGTYSRVRMSPASIGIQWMLSDAHPEPDICDDLAEADLYGMLSLIHI